MIYVITLIIIVVLAYGLYAYNKLVSRKNMVENQKSQIDVELQRRFDLIPNLVEVVKGYASHENKTLIEVVAARDNYVDHEANTAKALASNNSLSGALSRLFVLTENYPELLASKNFTDLQKELNNTEKQIAYSRQFYNDSVYRLNTLIDAFPTNIIASLFGFKKQAFFEAGDTERKSVNVNL